MNSERYQWIDMAKGYGIILVVVGHFHHFNLIYSFHLPLFFFLSGFTYSSERKTPKVFIVKKIKSLIIPYFCLGSVMVLFTCLWMYLSGRANLDSYISIVINFFIQNRMWTIWFIMCLFVLNLIYYSIDVFCNGNLVNVGLCSIGIFLSAVIYYNNGGVSLPWNVDASCMAIPFFYFGQVIRRRVDLVRVLDNAPYSKLSLFCIFLFLNVVFLYANLESCGYGLDMFSNQYGNYFFAYLSAFSGIVLMVILSNSSDLKPVKNIGKNSLIYFAWHQTILIPLIDSSYKHFNLFQVKPFDFFSETMRITLSTFVIFLILGVTDKMIRKSKIYFIFGM